MLLEIFPSKKKKKMLSRDIPKSIFLLWLYPRNYDSTATLSVFAGRRKGLDVQPPMHSLMPGLALSRVFPDLYLQETLPEASSYMQLLHGSADHEGPAGFAEQALYSGISGRVYLCLQPNPSAGSQGWLASLLSSVILKITMSSGISRKHVSGDPILPGWTPGTGRPRLACTGHLARGALALYQGPGYRRTYRSGPSELSWPCSWPARPP